MQPTKGGNDYRFWSDSIAYWHEKAEAYLSMGLQQDFSRCMDRADLALLNRKEVTGEILVYGPEIYARGT